VKHFLRDLVQGTQGQQEAISLLDFNKELLVLPENEIDLSAHLVKARPFPCISSSRFIQ
jgi:hypothetical protein